MGCPGQLSFCSPNNPNQSSQQLLVAPPGIWESDAPVTEDMGHIDVAWTQRMETLANRRLGPSY